MPRRKPPQPFDPLGFLKVAQDLASVGGEAQLRAAVGRAYYALFLLARGRTGAYPTSKNQSAHSVVISAVGASRGFAVANELNQLKKLRITADYELMPTKPGEQDWAKNWARAQWLVGRLLPVLSSI